MTAVTAPGLEVTEWLNGPPQDLASLRGNVVLIETFQMLCPGCVAQGLPQAQRVHREFSPDGVTVLGLHTVFEHHAVMGRDALAVFLLEYRIEFAVGIDRHAGDPVPVTMGRYGLRGTPSTILIDRSGRLRYSDFGVVDDLVLGSRLGRLLGEAPGESGDHASARPAAAPSSQVCTPDAGCR